MIGHFAKLAEIMKHSTEYMENIGKFLQNPENVAKFYIKDNGDGSYTSGQYAKEVFGNMNFGQEFMSFRIFFEKFLTSLKTGYYLFKACDLVCVRL